MAKKKSNEELDRDIGNLEKKIAVIEKFANEEKNKKDKRLDKLEKSSASLDNSTKTLRIDVQALDKNFEKELKEYKEKFTILAEEFTSFQKTLDLELEKVAEKDQVMEDLRSSVKEKTAILDEREKNLTSLEEKYSAALEKIAKLESDLSNLEQNYNQAKTLQEEMKKKLETIEGEYGEFKSREEPARAQNESIRRILGSHDQGKIFLALAESAPNSLTLDEIADRTGITPVKIKPSLLALEDLEVLEFNPSTREVKLI